MADLGPDVPLSVGSFIRQAIGEDIGVTAARSLFRELGIGKMSNTAFGQLYGQIRAAIGGRDEIAGLAYDAIPEASAYTEWAAGTPDRFSSFVEIFTREVGSREVTSHWINYTTDAAHTPQEAIDKAIDDYTTAASDGGPYEGQEVLGAVVTSMTRTVRRAS